MPNEANGGIVLSRVISFMFSLVYLIVGVVVAASHHYFAHLDSIKPIASAALAVLLWPLVLLGVNLHLR
jgi:membrane protein YdbS with pleckstrin-like domain